MPEGLSYQQNDNAGTCQRIQEAVYDRDEGTYGEVCGAAASDVTEVKAFNVLFQASIDWWVQSSGK